MSSGTFNWTGGTLLVNGTATANLSIPELGELSGSGTIIGDITSAGTISPGNSPGILTIDGNYVQAPTGILTIELGGLTPGSEHDQLIITGDASLGGTLNVQLLDGFQLGEGMQFNIISVGGSLLQTFAGLDQDGLVGTFDGIDLFIRYSTGDSAGVMLYTVPEPTAALVVAMSSIMLLRRRRVSARVR